MWAGAATLMVAGPAAAFYFPGWPADGLPRTPTLYGATTGFLPPDFQTDVTLIRPPGAVVTPDRPNPQTVPEPATFALAAFGLMVIAGRRMQNAKGKVQK